jgi:hypothetical protein
MPFTAAELATITNSALDNFVGKGEVYAQAIQNKPMMKAFDRYAKTDLTGGRGGYSFAIMRGKGELSLAGYTHDDVVSYGNPAQTQRVTFNWREHFIGMGLTHTELKMDGITVTESGADQTTSNKDGREEHALVNILDTKVKIMNEDYAVSWDALIHGDGTSDTKALAGIRSLILDNPALGSTGGVNRTTNSWWRNRAATAAANAASTGANVISSAATGGGVLLQFLQNEQRQLNRFSARKSRKFAGSAFIDAIERELRGNGQYAQTGWTGGDGNVDGAMPAVKFAGVQIEYDPTLDDLGLSKRMYDIDMNAIKLVYMKGEKMKKANPARPHDRFVMYQGMTTTALMVCERLNTSGVYDIA